MNKILSLSVVVFLLLVSSCKDSVSEDCGGLCPIGYECVSGTCVQTVTNSDVISGRITTPTTWSNDKIYELAGRVIVENTTLTIEPGTIIKGREGLGSLASALIIARGAKIEACGTADQPIIFTSVLDNIAIGQKTGTNLDQNDNEKWGGLIVLGDAPVSTVDGDTQGQIEGVPGDEEYGVYGGHNAADNSGSLCYVSVRHGGALIGDGNEINGITLGGVGNGTTINNIEIVANLDDGLELFGGTVNVTNLIVSFQDDDAIDIDQNYSGTIDNFYVIQGGDGTDEGLEIDGPEGSTYVEGKFILKNGTVISDDGQGSMADLKSKAQGTIENVVFTGYNSLAKVSTKFDADNNCADATDAYTKLIASDLILNNCEVVSSTHTIEDLMTAYTKTEGCEASLTDAYQTAADDVISASGNTIVEVASGNKGASKGEFSWSWTAMNNLLK